MAQHVGNASFAAVQNLSYELTVNSCTFLERSMGKSCNEYLGGVFSPSHTFTLCACSVYSVLLEIFILAHL